MTGYFEDQFDSLGLNTDKKEALEIVLEVLLYKSSTTKKFNSEHDKLNDFWMSSFTTGLTQEQLAVENCILALSQYIRSKSIDEKLLSRLLLLNQDSVIKAVRQSGIIAYPDHSSWRTLKQIALIINLAKFDEFLRTVDCMQLQYQTRFHAYRQLKQQLQLDQVTAMVFSSLYACEHLMADSDTLTDSFIKVPYQCDSTDSIAIHDVWRAFNDIITGSNIQKKELTEKSLALILKDKMMPFLLGEGLNDKLINLYQGFKALIAYRIEINLYQNYVVNAYSFDFETSYFLQNGQLKLENKDKSKDLFIEKFSILSLYWLHRGVDALPKSPYFYKLDRGENIEVNTLALAKTLSVVLQLKEIYGIQNAIFSEEHDLTELILTMCFCQAHYEQDFVVPLKKMLNNGNSPFIALKKIMMTGAVDGHNRMPITFAKKKDKAIRMRDYILEGSRNLKVKKMGDIIEFWSQDLRDGVSQSYIEKDFYKHDEYVFALPWLSAQKNFNTASINNFRKLHKNRPNLQSETDFMEKNLAKLLAKCEGQVYIQYEPTKPEVGEIDVIMIADNKVLIIELKSTYLKKSIKEINEYKNFVLKKAAYQLARKSRYVEEVLLPSINLDAAKFKIHAWIVDTTLEFDHEYIDGFLKISFEELLINLNEHQHFMRNTFEKDNAMTQMDKDIFSSMGKTSLSTITETIESNKFWKENLALYSSINNLSKAAGMEV